MKTREQALQDLARVVAEEMAIASRLTSREAAERVWHPGGPPVEELKHRIEILRRGGAPDRMDELTVDQTGAVLGITVKRLRVLRNAGAGPVWWKGHYGRFKYYRADVDEWTAAQSTG